MNDKTLKRFRRTAIWEGVSFLLLLGIAMPIKYGLGNPIPVKVVGMTHGILFIAYVIFLIQAAMQYSWPFKKVCLAFVASIVPFGPFLFDRRLERESTEEALMDATVSE
jgi:integral membrane protein